MKRDSVVDIFVSRDRQARIWFCLLVVAVVGFAFERHRLVRGLSAEPQVIVMDQNTYYLPKTADFSKATELHASQTILAMEALFNRSPKGPDNPSRLERLFEKDLYRNKVAGAIDAEALEFAAKQLHQKVELGPIQILRVRGHAVLTSAEGQLIRTGVFQQQNLVEVLEVKARFKFVLNKDMTSNGMFPTIVKDYDIITREVTTDG